MLPEHGQLTRFYSFGTCLAKLGHEPVVFVGSHPHNTSLQLIDEKIPYKVYKSDPFPWVLVRTCNYEGSKLKRIWSMFQYYYNAKTASKHFEKPDAIIGSSAHPLAAVLAIQLGKKLRCKAIVEIRDLWPESIVAYEIAGPKNPAVLLLRRLEKWIYKKADAVVFTMEGAYDYIVEQGWEKEIPRSKVHYINNGVDLEAFDYNREHYQVEDTDLDDPNTVKIVYTGSIRKVNNLGVILDAAKEIRDPRVKFLIWGDGDELPTLKQRLIAEGITNVVFKGRVGKQYIPSIVSRANLTFFHVDKTPLLKYGLSLNKMFEYLAAGKPIMVDFNSPYNPAAAYHSCIIAENEIVEAVNSFLEIPSTDYQTLCDNARYAGETYDFRVLTEKLVAVIEGTENC